MPWLGAAVGGVTGLLGLLQGSRGASLQNQYMQDGINSLNLQNQAQQHLYDLANTWNPVQEAQAGIGNASRVFQSALGTGLGNVASQFAGAGSAPGASSEFNVRGQDVTNRVSDPFQAYLAQVESNATQQKANMFADVLKNAPSGNLANSYFNAAGQYGQNFGPSLGNLSSSINSIFNKAPGSGSAGTPPAQPGTSGVPDGYSGYGGGAPWWTTVGAPTTGDPGIGGAGSPMPTSSAPSAQPYDTSALTGGTTHIHNYF